VRGADLHRERLQSVDVGIAAAELEIRGVSGLELAESLRAR